MRRMRFGKTFRWMFVLTTVAALLLAVTPTPGSGAGQMTIAFMRAGPDPYYQYGENAAKVAAGMLGIQLLDYMSNVDPATELANVRDAITRGVNGILMYAVSLSSERATVDAAAAKLP